MAFLPNIKQPGNALCSDMHFSYRNKRRFAFLIESQGNAFAARVKRTDIKKWQ
jgi:hypothetical protein